jgi:uncharacterized protein
VIESLPKTSDLIAETGYSKRISWVDKTNFVALKTEFYDPNGKLLKTATSSNIKLVDSEKMKWQALLLNVTNHQTGGKTIVTLDTFDANKPVDDKYFSVRYLEKEE